MNNSTKILYNHLKDYPTSTEGYHDVSIPAVAAALRFENKSKNESRETPPRTDVQEKSGDRRGRFAVIRLSGSLSVESATKSNPQQAQRR